MRFSFADCWCSARKDWHPGIVEGYLLGVALVKQANEETPPVLDWLVCEEQAATANDAEVGQR